MQVSKEEVERIAHLARLKLEGEELERLTKDFNQILGFVEELRQVDTTGVKPLTHVLELSNHYREDVAEEGIPIEEIRKFAVEFEGGYFVVPRVIES